ncbi:MAG: hypothetical protein NTV51_20815 [Verrucomicrobia bacterium]|nr:hypothetical protein [Verrucomicrobiota bacterium]
MFPQHPRHALWRETAGRWIASSFARAPDLARTDLVDGRPLRDWLTAPNLFDDFTLENHHRVHPDYMACTYLLSSQVPLYTWGGHTPPAALHLNVQAINTSLKRLALPDGAWIYPNGQDWGLRRNLDWFEYHTAQAVLYRDAQSATLQRACLATMKRMAARTPRGSIYVAAETRLASDDAMALELPAHAYALMAQLGEGPDPVAESQLLTQLAGRHVFEAGKFAVLRTPHSIATFSWGAQVMGQVLPLRTDQLLSPEPRGLVGYVGLAGSGREVPVAREISIAPLPDALGVTGVLTRAGGAVEQRFGFLALPDDRTIYVDVVRLTGAARPTLLDLGTLGVLNDTQWPSHTGTRTLVHDTGTRTFAAADATRDLPVEFHSRWFNLDGLGIVVLDASGGQRYVPAPTSAAGRLEQRFHLNAIPPASLAAATPATPAAHGVFVFYPNQTPVQTRSHAVRCVLRSPPGATLVELVLEDGTAVTFDLAHLRLNLTPAPAPRP